MRSFESTKTATPASAGVAVFVDSKDLIAVRFRSRVSGRVRERRGTTASLILLLTRHCFASLMARVQSRVVVDLRCFGQAQALPLGGYEVECGELGENIRQTVALCDAWWR